MASYRKKYTAKDFKKDKPGVFGNDFSESHAPEGYCSSDSSLSSYEDSEIESTDGESETSSDDNFDEDFKNEDKLISRLFREVVDEVMEINKISESKVNIALNEMRQEIFQAHKKGFRRFRGIDFNKSENCCGYLRRYAVCHTGLVKQIMWKFFKNKKGSVISKLAKNEILRQNHLKVVSLGGGPGNDLVGLCTALQELGNSIKELDLYIIDTSEGWKTVFPTILRKAASGDFGSFTKYVKKVKINTGFMEADLTAKGIFENKRLSNCLAEADIVLMVKLTSFLPHTEAGDLIHNVVDCMKTEAKLIFIDQPYDSDFFSKIQNLIFIYHSYVKYELSFNPAKYHSPSIESTQAHVGIYEKMIYPEDSSEDSSEEV